ncbi:hypothetical protein N9R86_01525 [Alphaproteobacteria bacterium]|nr:hypothetical protein [Alphaproteobacteria bacterium]MDA9655096.1 hypothetical protein [Pelagibacteraceae bacterium]
MIRLLIIVLVFLLLTYLLTQYFSKDKKEKIRFKLNAKYFLLIPAAIVIVIFFRYLPQIIAKVSVIKGLLVPFIGVIKNLIPFI